MTLEHWFMISASNNRYAPCQDAMPFLEYKVLLLSGISDQSTGVDVWKGDMLPQKTFSIADSRFKRPTVSDGAVQEMLSRRRFLRGKKLQLSFSLKMNRRADGTAVIAPKSSHEISTWGYAKPFSPHLIRKPMSLS